MSVSVLLVDVGPHRCGISGATVDQVVRACAVTPLGGAPGFVEGAINLHGEVVAVVDMRRRLGMPSRPVHPSDQLVIVEVRGRRLALRVDRAIDLTTVDDIDVLEADEMGPQTLAGAVPTPAGVLFIHDVLRFLTEAEQAELDQVLRQQPG